LSNLQLLCKQCLQLLCSLQLLSKLCTQLIRVPRLLTNMCLLLCSTCLQLLFRPCLRLLNKVWHTSPLLTTLQLLSNPQPLCTPCLLLYSSVCLQTLCKPCLLLYSKLHLCSSLCL
jgi:hypothetical protein